MKKQLWIVRLDTFADPPIPNTLVDLMEKFATTVGRAALVKSSNCGQNSTGEEQPGNKWQLSRTTEACGSGAHGFFEHFFYFFYYQACSI